MFRLTNYKKLLRIILILIVTNYQRKNDSSSIEKFLENCVTNYYRKYSNINIFDKLLRMIFINKSHCKIKSDKYNRTIIIVYY